MRKSFVFAISGVLLGTITAFLPLTGLSREACAGLGILVCGITWWVGHVLPDFVTALLMCTMYVLVCGVPMETVFSAFSQSTFWLLLSSFALSLGLSRCGLMDRLAMYILRLFPNSFAWQALGLIAAGSVIGPFIPNLSAKAAILAPIALSISDTLGYEHRSKASAGIFLAMLTGLRANAPLFISSSVLGYAFIGMYPEKIALDFTMLRWFLAALPWFLMVSGANAAMLFCTYAPKNGEKYNRDTLSYRINNLGEMSRAEKWMLLIVSVTMLLWATEGLHGVPAAIVSIAAMCASVSVGALDVKDFKTGMNWGPLLFVGATTGLAPTFASLGIDGWIVDAFRPLLGAVSASPALLLLAIAVVVILVRFVVASEVATVNLMLVFLVPLSLELGINPWVTGFAVYAGICPWFFLYQNPVYMTAYYATDEKMITQPAAAKYCAVFLAISLAALAVCVPVWNWMGILYL